MAVMHVGVVMNSLSRTTLAVMQPPDRGHWNITLIGTMTRMDTRNCCKR